MLSQASIRNRSPSLVNYEPSIEKEDATRLSRGRTIVLICSLNATVTVAAMNTGMMTVLLPEMAVDLQMSRSFLLWFGHTSLVERGYC